MTDFTPVHSDKLHRYLQLADIRKSLFMTGLLFTQKKDSSSQEAIGSKNSKIEKPVDQQLVELSLS